MTDGTNGEDKNLEEHKNDKTRKTKYFSRDSQTIEVKSNYKEIALKMKQREQMVNQIQAQTENTSNNNES